MNYFLSGAMFLLVAIGIHASFKFVESVQIYRDASAQVFMWHTKYIEAGGVPVYIIRWTKDIGQGNACVKVTEKVDIN